MTIRSACLLAALCLGAAAALAAASLTIVQAGQRFSARLVSVHPGDSIDFANQDDVTHNIHVIDADDAATDLGLQAPGEILSYRFDRIGRFQVRCSIHPSMKLTVDVK
jgi:cytochrome c peroxidase